MQLEVATLAAVDNESEWVLDSLRAWSTVRTSKAQAVAGMALLASVVPVKIPSRKRLHAQCAIEAVALQSPAERAAITAAARVARYIVVEAKRQRR